MEIYIKDLYCKYRWNEKLGCLEYSPELLSGEFEDFSPVEEDLVGHEPIMYQGNIMKLSDVYREIERMLNVNRDKKAASS